MRMLFLWSFSLLGLLASVAISAEKHDDLYRRAKQAYEKNSCRDAISLLEEYKGGGALDTAKLKSIDAAIAWCKEFESRGVLRLSGVTPTGGDIVTAEGRELLRTKPTSP